MAPTSKVATLRPASQAILVQDAKTLDVAMPTVTARGTFSNLL